MKTLLSLFLTMSLTFTPAISFAGPNGGYDFISKQILVLATSSVGSSVATQCLAAFKVPSVSLFMAGSLVHIGSELFQAKAENDNHKKKLKTLELKEEEIKAGGEYQKETLIQRKIDEEQTRDFIKKRITWMMAVGVIYAAGLGFSIAEETYSHAAGVTTGTTSCAGLAAAYASTCLVGYAACYAGFFAPCLASMSSGALTAEATVPSTGALVAGTAACTATNIYAPACTAYMTSYNAGAYAGCINTVPVKALSWKGLIGMAYGFMAGKMDGGAISQYGTMFMSLLTTVVPAVGAAVPTAYNYPIPRTITFAALEVLVGSVVSGLYIRKAKAEKNIELLNKLIANFESETQDPDGLETDGPGDSPAPPKLVANTSNVKALPTMAPTKSCITEGKDSFNYSPEGCKGKPIRMNKPFSLISGGNFSHLQSAGNLSTDLANSVASGDMQKAELLAGTLGSMASRVSAENKKLMDEFNKKQKAEGKKPIDFDKAIKERVASLEKSLEQASKSSGVSLASLGTPDSSAEEKTPTEPTATSSNVADLPVVQATPLDDGINLGGIEESAEFENSGSVATLSDRLNEFESSASDVVTDPGVSIFKQVSNRYLLNYEKVFSRKEIPVVKPADNE